MKRLVTIQDISCIGKCSLTVALPIISASGTEVAVVPTALLSVHTAFDKFTFYDLTDEIQNITDNWKEQNFVFDGIYTGYLGSIRQLELVSHFIDDFRGNNTLTVIDPVMGDQGRLYSGFTPEFAAKMKELCKKADIIVPNLTEAAFLTDTEYKTDYSDYEIKELLKKLSNISEGMVALTGICPNMEKIGVMAYNPDENNFFSYYGEKIDRVFHGTGDIFASAFCGALMKGIKPEKSLNIAVDFTSECIRRTLSDPDSAWYGVNFESALPCYIDLLKSK